MKTRLSVIFLFICIVFQTFGIQANEQYLSASQSGKKCISKSKSHHKAYFNFLILTEETEESQDDDTKVEFIKDFNGFCNNQNYHYIFLSKKHEKSYSCNANLNNSQLPLFLFLRNIRL